MQTIIGTDPSNFLSFDAIGGDVIDIESCKSLKDAVNCKRQDFVLRQINLGVDINEIDNYGSTALHLACQRVNQDIVETLLNHGADSNYPDRAGRTPLHMCCSIGTRGMPIARIILRFGCHMNVRTKYEGWTALYWAVSIGHPGLVDLLLNHGADSNIPSRDGISPLHCCILSTCKQEILKALINHGADIEAISDQNQGQGALHLAVMKGRMGAIQLLLNKGADCTKRDNCGRSPLDLACHYDQLGALKILLSRITKFDTLNTPLWYVLTEDKFDIATTLLHHGAELNFKDSEGNTPLHFACRNRKLNLLEYLMEKSHLIDFGSTDVEGNTALHLACLHGFAEGVRTLLTTRLSVDAKNTNGYPALHLACYYGYIDIIRSLIRAGADLECRDSMGNACIHIAFLASSADVLFTLLDFGANLSITVNIDHI